MSKQIITKKQKIKNGVETILRLAVLLLLAWGIVALFFPNFLNNDIEFLESHEEYFDNFLYQKTEESENYRFIRYIREVEYVDSSRVVEVDGEKYSCELEVVGGYSNDMILGTVVYKEDGVLKYWCNSLSSISTANKYIYEYQYTDITQIPDDEWETYTYSSYGSFALREVFILDSGASSEIKFTSYELEVSTDEYIQLFKYNTYDIPNVSALSFKEDEIKIQTAEMEIFFEDGLAVKSVVYKDLNNDGEFSEDEIIELKIQDMYGDVDFDALGF